MISAIGIWLPNGSVPTGFHVLSGREDDFMSAQIYITIVLVAFLFTIPFGIYLTLREKNYSWHVRNAQANIIDRLQVFVPREYIDKVTDIITEELEPLMKG